MPRDLRTRYHSQEEYAAAAEALDRAQPAATYPVEYRWGVQFAMKTGTLWLCSDCLATRIIARIARQPTPIVVAAIHADPLDPHPTCADCETRDADIARAERRAEGE